ncbi:ATP-sensitive inward rectifier potassium channel 1-like [Denticeps clupeoides]|uniref:ATP-sensitive inward rectifier potassium channel 1-like n=1 Tax=Denticeps clupeoides TaxID=299321 RepID=UPI0010A4BF24|nr:ATP-sensitive inward rectifier potassium channel 1-like [Denticeps clupeoides]
MFQFIQKHIHSHLAEHRSKRTRLVTKDGHCNIKFGNISYYNHAFLMDFWTTFVEIRWRFVLSYFAIAFIGSWFIFGSSYNNILYVKNATIRQLVATIPEPGVDNTGVDKPSGRKATRKRKHLAPLVDLCVEKSQKRMVKKPQGRNPVNVDLDFVTDWTNTDYKAAKTVMFSDTAAICLKKGTLCFLIRVANLRKTLLIGTQIYGKLLRTTVTQEGETIILDQVNIDFAVDAGKDNLFFVCPLMLYHIIDKSSPFFEMAADTLLQQDFELVVFLDGTAESTSSTFQVRTSYTPQEIQWGYSFLPVISRTKEGRYHVDFSKFSKTVQVSAPHCAHCFHSDSGHKHSQEIQEKQGIDNPGFEVIDIDDVTAM